MILPHYETTPNEKKRVFRDERNSHIQKVLVWIRIPFSIFALIIVLLTLMYSLEKNFLFDKDLQFQKIHFIILMFGFIQNALIFSYCLFDPEYSSSFSTMKFLCVVNLIFTLPIETIFCKNIMYHKLSEFEHPLVRATFVFLFMITFLILIIGSSQIEEDTGDVKYDKTDIRRQVVCFVSIFLTVLVFPINIFAIYNQNWHY